MSEELRIGEDNICPITKKLCDDECCPPGAICNLSGDTIQPTENKIVITEWDYKHGDSKFPTSMVQKDDRLSEAIMDYYKRILEPADVEIWVHDYNILATSKKFYGAFYEKDLKHADK